MPGAFSPTCVEEMEEMMPPSALKDRLQVHEKVEVGRALDKQVSEECGRVRCEKCMETPDNLVLADSKGQGRE